MPTTDWQRVIEVFDVAVLRGPGERAAFLDEACGSDLELRREVESLLAHDAAAGGQFLEPVGPPTVIREGAGVQRGATDGRKGVRMNLCEAPKGPSRQIHPDTFSATDEDRRIGATVAGYRLISIIATGGMGAVYRAHQEKLKREVAIKIVRPGLAAAGALRRLEHEAQFLARLRHAHIAQVYEAGTFRDPATGLIVPYFVMELVEGALPITAYCGGTKIPHEGIRTPDASPGKYPAVVPSGSMPPTRVGGSDSPLPARVRGPDGCENPPQGDRTSGDAGKDSRDLGCEKGFSHQPSLPLRDRLTLFLQVCDAVHHGHQRGLIHRDLKPGNILVDSTGQVKIIDFGIARSTDADITLTTMQTDSGQLVGTLQYMSPEQCAADAADLDVRSDVYSLGVVLYQLVCDKLPYDLAGATIVTAARMVCEQPADPLRKANARVPRDIEAIALRCLEKDRARRYQSAAQLGDDIRRHLVGESITARPPGGYRRLVRWIARHALAATAIACVGMVSLTAAGLAVGIHLAGLRPNKLWISADNMEVQLETIVGHRVGPILRGGHTGGLEALPGLTPHGHEHLAIIGLTATNGALTPGLYAFDARMGASALTPDGIVWQAGIAAETIPPPPAGRSFSPEHFWIYDVMLLDVFPEISAPEIVSLWSHERYSWRALCIHDLDGNLLYQIWHDGSIAQGHTQWLSDAGLLVLMGTYCTHRPWLISPELPREVEAVPVVFALRPRLGQIERKLISVPELDEWRDKSEGRDTSKGPRAQPEWYKFVWPLHREYRVSAAALNVRTSRRLAAQAHGAAAYVQLRFLTEAGADLGGLHWEINQHGTAIPDSFVVSDPYVQSRDAHKLSLPAPDQFRLVDLEEMLADPFGEIAYGTAADSLASQPPPTASQDP